MNILHICTIGPYTDNFSYQENLLSKYHVLSGNNTTIIASQYAYGEDGSVVKLEKGEYINDVGVKIVRLPIKNDKGIHYHFKRYEGFYNTIENCRPDIIFIHNLQFVDIKEVVKYAKEHKVTIYADNHADFSNSARNSLGRIFYKTVWKHYATMLNPYVKKFYGVLPIRVDFLTNIYGLPKQKCELLVMGADDEEVVRVSNPKVRDNIRAKYNIKESDFLIVTGGKIDAAKTQTLLLMEAVKKFKKVKLLVFGSVAADMKKKFDSLVDNQMVQYIGWIKGNNSYDIFSAADLVVFPGRHSVYWEQVAGIGRTMICKYWEGTTHVDLGGNVEFLYKDSVDEIYEKIMDIVEHKEKYERMKSVAEEKGMEVFSYKKIAERSIR